MRQAGIDGSIHGFKYEDVDGDGVYNDLVDLPLGGVEFVLTGTDVLGNPVNESTFTDVTGKFAFVGVVPGSYTVTETVPAGHVATTPIVVLGRRRIRPGTGGLRGPGGIARRR